MTPNSDIMLCQDTNLFDKTEGGYDTIYFSSAQEQYNWFKDKAIIVNPLGTGDAQYVLSGQMYARVSDKTLRLKMNRFKLMGVDYMVLKNQGQPGTAQYETFTHYCFVDEVRYISEEVTEIDYHEDVFQTYIMSLSFKKTFVKRLTTASDEIFEDEHKNPDMTNGSNLECYDIKKIVYDEALQTDSTDIYIGKETESNFLVVCCTDFLYPFTDDTGFNVGRIKRTSPGVAVLGEVPNSCEFYIADIRQTTAFHRVYDFATRIPQSEYKDSLAYVTMMPEIALPVSVTAIAKGGKAVFLASSSQEVTDANTQMAASIDGWDNPSDWYAVSQSNFAYERQPWRYSLSALKARAFGDYSPVNKKLYNYPYCKIVIDNQNGGEIELEPQHLKPLYDDGAAHTEANIKFGGNVYGVMSHIPYVGITAAYDLPVYSTPTTSGETDNKEVELSLIPAPDVGVIADNFKQWLNQAKLTLPLTIASSALSAVYTGGIGGMMGAGSSALGIVGQGAGIYTQAVNALSQGTGLVGGSTNANLRCQALSLQNFRVRVQSLSEGDAKIIDDYFSAYGYAMEREISPYAGNDSTYYGMNNRPNWNYIQTIGCKPMGSVPYYAKKKIAEIFDNGVRMWNKSNYLNYSVTNAPT